MNDSLADYYYINKMFKELQGAVNELRTYEVYVESKESEEKITKRFSDYDDCLHYPSERKRFYRSLCNDYIRVYREANDIAYKEKTARLNALPESAVGKLFIYVFTDTTYPREMDKINENYDKMKRTHETIINSFQRILNRY